MSPKALNSGSLCMCMSYSSTYVHVCASVRVIAGNFQVVLIVDNQETTTKSMFRGVLLKELSRYGEHALHLLPPGAGSALCPAQGQPVIASFTPTHCGVAGWFAVILPKIT